MAKQTMYRSFEPTAELRPFVECYWAWSFDPATERLDPLLPDAAPEFMVHLASPPLVVDRAGHAEVQPVSFLYFAARYPVVLQAQGPMDIFSIRFRPWGTARFSERPMVDLLDRSVPPQEALGDLGVTLAQGLIDATDSEARAKFADLALTDALGMQPERGARILALATSMSANPGPSETSAESLGMSDRSFRRFWREVVGLSPQRYIALMRFHKAIAKIESGEGLAMVATECGYCDQPHMARQIKAVSGLSASQLRERLGSDAFRLLYGDRPTAPWRADS